MKHDRIETNPSIMDGRPVIKGTRITVEQILRECALGVTPEVFLDEHPHIVLEDVRAALAYAADHLRQHAAVAAQ